MSRRRQRRKVGYAEFPAHKYAGLCLGAWKFDWKHKVWLAYHRRRVAFKPWKACSGMCCTPKWRLVQGQDEGE